MNFIRIYELLEKSDHAVSSRMEQIESHHAIIA